ncbi:MAG: hypothetical protein ABL886_01770, partial [Rhodoglobus sp.]
MPATNDSSLALAGLLRNFSDPALVELLAAREIRESSIRDFFDLADALLDPDSIQHALGRLDRSALASLAALGDRGPTTLKDAAAHVATLELDPDALPTQLAAAAGLALATEFGGRWDVPESVAAQLRSWPVLGLPGLEALVSEPAPAALAPVSSIDPQITDHVASEHAFHTTTSI